MTSITTSRPPNPACRVCGGEASGFHYGVDSCEGCKGFFRRCLTQGLTNKCTNDEKCEITPVSRNSCQFCRLKKCRMVGMSKEGSRLGRRPKRLKQCQGQTNDSLPPPPIHQPSNENGTRYNRMYPNNSVTTALNLQNTEFSDNYTPYRFQQLNNNHHMGVNAYQRVVKPEPDEQFLYSEQEVNKSRGHYKNGTNSNRRFTFNEKLSSSFQVVSGKNESLLIDGVQFGVHIKQEVQQCDGTLRANFGSLESLPRDASLRNTPGWNKNGFQLTNSSSSEHLEEGEIPIRRMVGGTGPSVDIKTSVWSSLDSSPHPSSLNDQWTATNSLNEEDFKNIYAIKKSGKSGSLFLQSEYGSIRDRRSSCHLPFSGSDEVGMPNNLSGVVVKSESMTSDDDETSALENGSSTFSQGLPRYSVDHSASFNISNPSATNSTALEPSDPTDLSNGNPEINGQNAFANPIFPKQPTSTAAPFSNNGNKNPALAFVRRAKSVNMAIDENLCRGLARGLYGLTLQEVKGPIPHEKMELINQVIETVTVAHSATCLYTSMKFAEGTEKYEDSQKNGQPQELDPNNIWRQFVDNMTPVIQRVVKFSKRLPGFCEIGQEDQISLIKQGSFEVILTRYTKLFRGDSMFVPNMTILVTKDVIGRMPLGDFFQEQVKFANTFNHFNLSDDEIGLLTAIMIVCPDRTGLQNVRAIQQLNLLFLQSLYIYMQRARPDNYNEFFDNAADILQKIRHINDIHSIKVRYIKLYPSTEFSFPPLHEEVFDETLC